MLASGEVDNKIFVNMCLYFKNCTSMLEGYTDADMGGDLDSRKSTFSFIVTFAGGDAYR